MNYNVRILRKAEEDVNAIYLWLAKRESRGAGRWFQAFLQAAASLADHPTSNALAPEAPLVRRDVRQLLFRTRRGLRYRLLYLVDGNEERILRVRGPGQPPVTPDDIESKGTSR